MAGLAERGQLDQLSCAVRSLGKRRPAQTESRRCEALDNVVSYTFTIESTGGNGIVVPGWGFLRLDLGASLPDAIAAPRASQRNTATTVAESAFVNSTLGQQLTSQYSQPFSTTPEIGAVTGIEFPGQRPGSGCGRADTARRRQRDGRRSRIDA
jgi:hypothetical protein